MLFRTSSHMWGSWYLCAYVSIQWWIIDHYVYSFFYQPHEVVILPPHYTEVIQCSDMTCDVTVVINQGRGLEMFSEPLSKHPCWFSYILLFTFQPVTLVPIYDATLFCYEIFVFRCHQEVFDCLGPSKVNLYAMLLTYVFETFTEASCVCYCYVIYSEATCTCCLFHSYPCCCFFLVIQEHWSSSFSHTPDEAMLG